MSTRSSKKNITCYNMSIVIKTGETKYVIGSNPELTNSPHFNEQVLLSENQQKDSDLRPFIAHSRGSQTVFRFGTLAPCSRCTRVFPHTYADKRILKNIIRFLLIGRLIKPSEKVGIFIFHAE